MSAEEHIRNRCEVTHLETLGVAANTGVFFCGTLTPHRKIEDRAACRFLRAAEAVRVHA